MTRKVPVIDLTDFRTGRDKQAVVEQVADACRSIGFLVISGHGVPAEMFDAMLGVSKGFFDLPVETKKRAIPADGSFRGYSELANMSLGQSLGDDAPPDLREGFSVNRVQDKSDPYFSNPAAGKLFAPNVWPDPADVPGFEQAFSDYYLAMEEVATTLMRIFALALELPEDFFDAKVDKHFTNLVAYHYPPMPAAPKPGQLRGGAHTDFGSLTLVYGHPSVSGLQVWDGSEWEDVPVEPGTLVVNLGDLMAQWTNDQWVSTLHRVANPPESEWDKARYSLIFFHQPNYDCVIESLDQVNPAKYPPTTSGEHLRRKILAMRVAA